MDPEKLVLARKESGPLYPKVQRFLLQTKTIEQSQQ